MKDTAIVVYLDTDEWAIAELGWLYRSWKYSRSDYRSDLIVFHNPSVEGLNKKYPDIRTVGLPPIYDTMPVWEDYPRINSTWFLTTEEAARVVHEYLYTFRTDIDCFLTKNFVDLRPRLAHFGQNVYETENMEVSERIRQLCLKYKIKRYNIGIDCHAMMYSKNMTEYAKVQYHIASKLKLEEFTNGHGEWPGWYEYVINMYSAGLAANALFKFGVMVGGLSSMSMSSEPIGSTDYNIHAWHTSQHFSKLLWREGYYDCLDFDALSDDIMNQYCMKMAGRLEDI